MNTAQHHWSLHDLTAGIPVAGEIPDLLVTGLSADSRTLSPGDAFVALKGLRGHGLDHLESVKQHGAVAVLYDESDAIDIPADQGIPLVKVEGLKSQLGKLADRFFGSPSSQLGLVGVTGTNGKTSICHYLLHALNQVTSPCGYIGTTGYVVGDHFYSATSEHNRTTPDVISVHALLDKFVQHGAGYAAMEVSSHALDQGRVDGVKFEVVVFTNLSRDHLDYHASMEDYAEAKRKLLYQPGVSCAVVNVDDAEGREWLKKIPEGMHVITCSAGGVVYPGEHLYAGKVMQGVDGLELEIVSLSAKAILKTGLLGRFNVDNLLMTVAVLQALDISLENACQLLSSVQAAPGRMQRFGGDGSGSENKPLVVVDYAHTPDALEKALLSLKAHCTGNLLCVFGCGGERDTGKRPLMGEIAEQLADRVYITDDNPRNESPVEITDQIQAGMEGSDAVVVIHDRFDAINSAISWAISNGTGSDCVLVAGKGHEAYQLVGNDKRDFSDSAVVEHALREPLE